MKYIPPSPPRPRVWAWAAALTGAALLALSGRYGYHRDELYFVQAGRHLSWGYPDQPPLVPLLARAMTALSPDSLVVLRLPSTVAAAGLVAIGGLTARALGAKKSGQLLAAAGTAGCGFVLATGHLLSTSTFALFGSALFAYLCVRLLQGADQRLWLAAGATAGVTLQANLFPSLMFAGFVLCLIAAGPREVLRRRWPWLGGALAMVIAGPYLLWQARHGWPQVEIARGISDGGSASSVSRALFVPLEILQAGPGLVLLWLPGLVRLCRDRRLRSLAYAFLLLQIVLVSVGGKPYYAAGLLPLMIAAGAQPVADRARVLAPVALAILSIPGIVFTLPVLPMRDASVAVAVNPDAGETIGWPQFVQQVARAYRTLPPGAALLTQNYGQAGAIDRYGQALGLPPAFSGHNAYGGWATPPGQSNVLAIGIPEARLARNCRSVRPAGRIVDPIGIENDEDDTRMFVCEPVAPWRQLWPAFVHLS